MKLSNQRKSMLMNQELINNENLKMVRKWICDIMRAADFREDEIDIVDLCVYGSRTNGRAHADSDLDILLEYKGRAREDTVFNVLHDTLIYIQGIIVDINPIKAECSGTIYEYLKRCDDSWKEHKVKRGKGR